MLKTQCCLSQCSHRGGFVFLSSDSKPRTKQQLVIAIKWGDELGIMWKPSVTTDKSTQETRHVSSVTVTSSHQTLFKR